MGGCPLPSSGSLACMFMLFILSISEYTDLILMKYSLSVLSFMNLALGVAFKAQGHLNFLQHYLLRNFINFHVHVETSGEC